MPYSVCVDSNDNVYVAGFFSTTFMPSSADAALKSFSSDGTPDLDLIWTEDSGSDAFTSVIVDDSGNIYLGGYGKNLAGSGTEEDWWIKKLDPSGTELWEKKVDGGGGDSSMGAEDRVYQLVLDSNDNLYAIGVGFNLVGTDTLGDWWIKKFDSDGNEITTGWDKKIDNVGTGESAFTGVVDSNDRLYVAGSQGQSDNSLDIWIKAFDSDGTEDTTDWDITYDYNGANDFIWSAVIDSYGDLYLGGSVGQSFSQINWFIRKYVID